MAETGTGGALHAVKRREVLVGSAAVGLGALIATAAVRSTRASAQPLSDELKLRHLLRRAGFGAGLVELAQYRKLGLAGTVDRLLDFDAVDNRALEDRLARANLDPNKRDDIQRWWLLRMIYTARPLEEKLTLFWHGLLTSAISKVGRAEPMLVQNRFFRAHALDSFPAILKGVSVDPAMMVWLDLQTNRKGHANENYSRELMELFSLGVGHYTEQDVRESGRAFTGWTVRRQKVGTDGYRFSALFRPRLHDDGVKTFLGQTGNFNGDDIVDIIVTQPASASFITRKLFSFFVYPNPTDDVLRPFVNVYTTNAYSIKAVVKAILTSDVFYSPASYRALVKSPAELVAGTARLLGAETDARGLPGLMLPMGQELFNPPNVAGWPGGPAWLTSGTWLARLNFANRVIAALGPAAPSTTASGKRPAATRVPLPMAGAASPRDAVGQLTNLLLDGQVDPTQQQVLLDYLGSQGGTPVAAASARPWLDERARGALYLALAMPEYHLA